ncbi:DUF1622 domain-containing protein [Vagococcus sp.]|uniref:DUF1622 domain-containing protein n=1 Tax=Vagococcus sp. TaxID=1933889 RepID=UPI003F9D1014
MERVIEWIEVGIDYIAIFILLFGGLRAFINFLRIEILRFEHPERTLHKDIEKVHLSSYILLSIQFMIISDLIRTVTSTSFKNIIFVSILIIVRGLIAKLVVEETTITKKHIETEMDRD